MEGDHIPPGQIPQPLGQLLVQGRKARQVRVPVGGNLLRLRRAVGHQPARQVFHHDLRIARVQPDVGVVRMIVAVVLLMVMLSVLILRQQRHALAGIHHRQVGEGIHHVGEVAFHTRAVDEKHIRHGQGFHVPGLQLIVVQAAGAGGGQVAHGHALHALRQVQGKQINGIKGGNHRFRHGAGRKKQQRRQQRGKHFFHE